MLGKRARTNGFCDLGRVQLVNGLTQAGDHGVNLLREVVGDV
jgi:hypothetical protein